MRQKVEENEMGNKLLRSGRKLGKLKVKKAGEEHLGRLKSLLHKSSSSVLH